ncbi:tetratricopeptide repeat protein [Methylovulum psychrotolerans]|uniref:Tetratricopeptide repeat-containing protein n=1 Tax=Methylovulum psychrotolerans TaxID=1704499 RepID=A0A2S5CJX5_9GAMM|nr:tetratricopeptide repeat protein [Methylovulum psychrotolerans]POZ51088.1 tetratricopeptide repeat-containing protein [Methylovulum psychrotolerans]
MVLTLAEEEQWQEFSRHVEWAERFCLIILFVEDALLAGQFLQRLQNQLQGQVSSLHILKPSRPESLAADIFEDLRRCLVPHTIVPCWLELHQHRSPEWQRALDNFFARFNENRDRIRRDYPCPFIILLPVAYKSRLREIAPDLWSVRNHTDELRLSQQAPVRRSYHEYVTPKSGATPLTVSEQALMRPEIREWQRVQSLEMADDERFLVTIDAFDEALESGQWALAEGLAQQLLTLSHNILADEGETTSALRKLGIALDGLGNIEKTMGRYDAAYQAYVSCLQIDRELTTNANPQILRDLSVSLGKVADIDSILGRYDAAYEGYAESLQICRGLKDCLGDSPQALRDLSVLLNKVADIDKILGRYDAAYKDYAESLQIRRELKDRLGGSPEVLRDLSVSLDRVADIDKILGRYDAAHTGYAESLQIRRGLRDGLGDTPGVLQDLSVSLDRVADIDKILGRYDVAYKGYAQSLQIRRGLKDSLGETPEMLRDLSVSLEKVADIDSILNRYEVAYKGYTENLRICRELKNRFRVTPQILRDLGIALEKQADCLCRLGRDGQALAAYQECLPLLERLQAALSYDEYPERIAKIKQAIADLDK